MQNISYRRHRFHPDIIRQAVWLYFRFTMSYRDVEDLLAERGIDVTYETVRLWVLIFGQAYAHRIRKRRPTVFDHWRIVQAIKDGIPALTLKDELMALESTKVELETRLATAPESITRLLPNLAEVYRKKVAKLADALNEENARSEAAEAIRGLIDEIRLIPKDGDLKIELYGELAALIALANKHPQGKTSGAQVTLVAGARCHLYRTKKKWRKCSA